MTDLDVTPAYRPNAGVPYAIAPERTRRADAPPNAAPVWLRAGLAVACLVVLAWSGYSLSQPLAIDQGYFVWVGDVILRGGLPYRDAWDIKGPFAYYVAAVPQLLFGRNDWGIRALDLAWNFAGAALLAATVRRLVGGRVAALFAALSFLLWHGSLNFENTAQPDGWAGVVLLVMFWALVRGGAPDAGWLWGVVAGSALGLCGLFKPTYAAYGLVPLVYATLLRRRVETRAVAILAATASAAIVVVALGVGYFAARGALDDLIEVVVRWNAAVYADYNTEGIYRLQIAAGWLLGGPLTLAFPLAIGGAAVLWRRARPECAALLTWIGVALLTVVLQGKFFPYHWLPLHAPLAVLVAAAVQPLLGVLRTADGWGDDDARRVGRFLTLGAAALTLSAAMLTPTLAVYRWVKLVAGGGDRDAYEAREYEVHGRQRASFRGIGEYVRQHTRPSDPVLLYGPPPGTLYAIGRRTPGRFGAWLPLEVGRGTPFLAAYRREFLEDLAAMPPAMVVIPSDSSCAATDYQACTGNFPELRAFVADGYVPDTVLASLTPLNGMMAFDVYRRRDRGAPR